MHINILLAIK